jgi:hypothetical protein
MPEPRYPTDEEFWRRLEARDTEPDLRATLRRRAERTDGQVTRLGHQQTIVAFVERLLPGSRVPAPVIAAFMDEHFDEPLGRADERAGLLPRCELFPAGFCVLDAAAGGSFWSLEATRQDELIGRMEAGSVPGPAGFDSAVWFKRIRDIALLAFGSDPRGMVQMGYPGPPYKPGHLWLSKAEIASRTKRRPGYLSL